MTTVDEEIARCGVCGTEQRVDVIMSTNAFGSPDLDTRPPPMRRDLLGVEIQECDDCGYCAADISRAEDETRGIVRSEEYRQRLHDSAFPRLANRYLCWSMILEKQGELADAAWAAIRAAWACDDEEATDAARVVRMRAVSLIDRAREEDQLVMPIESGYHVVRADLLRRAGAFEEARATISEGLSEVEDEPIRSILGYQQELVEKGDEDRHLVSEVAEA